jgi:hypothetical protein
MRVKTIFRRWFYEEKTIFRRWFYEEKSGFHVD